MVVGNSFRKKLFCKCLSSNDNVYVKSQESEGRSSCADLFLMRGLCSIPSCHRSVMTLKKRTFTNTTWKRGATRKRNNAAIKALTHKLRAQQKRRLLCTPKNSAHPTNCIWDWITHLGLISIVL